MVEGLTKAVGIAGTIGTDIFLTNVVKKIEDDDTSTAEKISNRVGVGVISSLIGVSLTKSMNQVSDKLLEQHEKSVGLEVIGYIE